jgi:hypothetical protein
VLANLSRWRISIRNGQGNRPRKILKIFTLIGERLKGCVLHQRAVRTNAIKASSCLPFSLCRETGKRRLAVPEERQSVSDIE